MKRYGFDLALLAIGVLLLISGAYLDVTSPAQLLLFKAITVSAGVLHAHVAGKLIFPKVNWNSATMFASTYARIAFYITIPIAYTFGG